MASVVTVVSRFCYRSPTRPLFVGCLILMILITWKFLTAQPDGNALMMQSKLRETSGKLSNVVQTVPGPAQKHHVPLRDLVKKGETGKLLGNKLAKLDEVKKREKVYDDEEKIAENGDGIQDLKTEKLQEKHSKNTFSSGEITNSEHEEKSNDQKNGGNQDNNSKQENNTDTTTKGNVNDQDFSTSLSNQKLYQTIQSNTNQSNTNQLQENQSEPVKVEEFNLLLTLVKMSPNSDLARSMKKCLKSICRYTSIKLNFYVVVDDVGKKVVHDFFQLATGRCKGLKVTYFDVQKLTKKLKPMTHVLQEFFSSGPDSYYNDPIFFMSAALHQVLPKNFTKIIMIDVDTRFVSDIKPLFDMFNNFKKSQIMGLALEQSPVYRHIFNKYRNNNEDTLVGGPPPNGIAGFNTGVCLLHLENMRKSESYNKISNNQIRSLSDKYYFKGHLGDQDFFTLLSVEYPEMFYTFPCSWNRQLCLWWKNNGYSDVFDLYNNCSAPIHVYHGNCRTKISVNDEE